MSELWLGSELVWSNPPEAGHFAIKLRKQIAEQEIVRRLDMPSPKVIFAIEKTMLDHWERDGELGRTVIGFKGDYIEGTNLVDNTEHARLSALAYVTIHKCDAVMQISEGWKKFYPIHVPIEDMERPSLLPPDDREECVFMSLASKNGARLMIEYTVDKTTRKLVNRRVANNTPDIDTVLNDLWSARS